MYILNRHISKATVLLLLFYFSINTAYAQRCGGGTYTVNIYALMGAKNEEIHYELFELNQDSVQAARKATNDGSYKSIRINDRDWGHGKILYVNTLQNILLADSLRNPHEKSFSELLKKNKTAKTGLIKNATLTFPTSETYYELYLLKIYTQNQTIYIIGNFFGGCNAGCGIIWGNYPRVVDEVIGY